jgi:hypothetical protein
MSALDREIRLALDTLSEKYPYYFDLAYPEQYEVNMGYHSYLTGWLLSKGFPADDLDIVEIINKYKESK